MPSRLPPVGAMVLKATDASRRTGPTEAAATAARIRPTVSFIMSGMPAHQRGTRAGDEDRFSAGVEPHRGVASGRSIFYRTGEGICDAVKAAGIA